MHKTERRRTSAAAVLEVLQQPLQHEGRRQHHHVMGQLQRADAGERSTLRYDTSRLRHAAIVITIARASGQFAECLTQAHRSGTPNRLCCGLFRQATIGDDGTAAVQPPRKALQKSPEKAGPRLTRTCVAQMAVEIRPAAASKGRWDADRASWNRRLTAAASSWLQAACGSHSRQAGGLRAVHASGGDRFLSIHPHTGSGYCEL